MTKNMLNLPSFKIIDMYESESDFLMRERHVYPRE